VSVTMQVSSKMGVSNRHVRNLLVWGEHGETSLVDAQFAQIQQLGQWNMLGTALHDDRWLRHDLVKVKLSNCSGRCLVLRFFFLCFMYLLNF